MKKNDVFGMWKSPASRRNVILLILSGLHETVIGSRFPTEKHFVSRLGLSPKNKQSGKMKRRIKTREKNQAGLIFRQSAQSLLNSKHNATGAFMRRLRGRKDAAAVIKAGARKIAIAVYNALTKGLDYVEQGTAKYAELLALRERHTLQRLVTKLNYQLFECK